MPLELFPVICEAQYLQIALMLLPDFVRMTEKNQIYRSIERKDKIFFGNVPVPIRWKCSQTWLVVFLFFVVCATIWFDSFLSVNFALALGLLFREAGSVSVSLFFLTKPVISRSELLE